MAEKYCISVEAKQHGVFARCVGESTCDLNVRVVLNSSDIRKVKLKIDEHTSLDSVKNSVKDSVNVKGNFVLQYLDKKFGDYCNVSHVKEIENFSTLKLVQKEEVTDAAPTSHNANLPNSTEGVTASVSHEKWPESFPLPNFDEVDPPLAAYLNKNGGEGKVNLSDVHRRKVINCLANSIARFTVYPKYKDIDHVCLKLITKFPALRDGGPSGFSSWSVALRYKICNLRKTLKGVSEEVDVNKRKNKDDPPNKGIKKQRRGITRQFVAEESVEEGDLQKEMQEEMKKWRPDLLRVS